MKKELRKTKKNPPLHNDAWAGLGGRWVNERLKRVRYPQSETRLVSLGTCFSEERLELVRCLVAHCAPFSCLQLRQGMGAL